MEGGEAPTLGGEGSGFPQSRGEAEEVMKLGYRARDLKCKYKAHRCVSKALWLLKLTVILITHRARFKSLVCVCVKLCVCMHIHRCTVTCTEVHPAHTHRCAAVMISNGTYSPSSVPISDGLCHQENGQNTQSRDLMETGDLEAYHPL